MRKLGGRKFWLFSKIFGVEFEVPHGFWGGFYNQLLDEKAFAGVKKILGPKMQKLGGQKILLKIFRPNGKSIYKSNDVFIIDWLVENAIGFDKS